MSKDLNEITIAGQDYQATLKPWVARSHISHHVELACEELAQACGLAEGYDFNFEPKLNRLSKRVWALLGQVKKKRK
jgi:hypothetical protein